VIRGVSPLTGFVQGLLEHHWAICRTILSLSSSM